MNLDIDKPFLFVSDIDGTLITRRGKTSEITNRIIKSALHYRNGSIFKFVLASGRSIEQINNVIKEIGLLNEELYLIACNGSIVQDIKKKKNLSFKYIDRNILESIIQIYKKNTKGKEFTNVSTLNQEYKLYKGRITRIYENWIRYTTKYVESIENLLNDEIIKVSTFSLFKNNSERIYIELKNKLEDKITIIHSMGNRLIEIMPPNTNKLKGIQCLQNYLKIPDHQVIVIGDNDNDVQMLEYYENSYVVKNGSSLALKAAKNKLPKSNKEDAIAHLILKIMN